MPYILVQPRDRCVRDEADTPGAIHARTSGRCDLLRATGPAPYPGVSGAVRPLRCLGSRGHQEASGEACVEHVLRQKRCLFEEARADLSRAVLEAMPPWLQAHTQKVIPELVAAGVQPLNLGALLSKMAPRKSVANLAARPGQRGALQGRRDEIEQGRPGSAASGAFSPQLRHRLSLSHNFAETYTQLLTPTLDDGDLRASPDRLHRRDSEVYAAAGDRLEAVQQQLLQRRIARVKAQEHKLRLAIAHDMACDLRAAVEDLALSGAEATALAERRAWATLAAAECSEALALARRARADRRQHSVATGRAQVGAVEAELRAETDAALSDLMDETLGAVRAAQRAAAAVVDVSEHRVVAAVDARYAEDLSHRAASKGVFFPGEVEPRPPQ